MNWNPDTGWATKNQRQQPRDKYKEAQNQAVCREKYNLGTYSSKWGPSIKSFPPRHREPQRREGGKSVIGDTKETRPSASTGLIRTHKD